MCNKSIGKWAQIVIYTIFDLELYIHFQNDITGRAPTRSITHVSIMFSKPPDQCIKENEGFWTANNYNATQIGKSNEASYCSNTQTIQKCESIKGVELLHITKAIWKG